MDISYAPRLRSSPAPNSSPGTGSDRRHRRPAQSVCFRSPAPLWCFRASPPFFAWNGAWPVPDGLEMPKDLQPVWVVTNSPRMPAVAPEPRVASTRPSGRGSVARLRRCEQVQTRRNRGRRPRRPRTEEGRKWRLGCPEDGSEPRGRPASCLVLDYLPPRERPSFSGRASPSRFALRKSVLLWMWRSRAVAARL